MEHDTRDIVLRVRRKDAHSLERLIEMLEKNSPLLIHGCFTKAIPMGCLATHVAWNHPRTCHLTLDAGISWLHRYAEVLNKELHDGRFDMTVRVDETKRDIVVSRFDAVPRVA